ncbi:hypothetical protein PVNG_04355 [Plasmodium vivax North Korean]|uniref:Uncharacterized protein n=1 Tax=Plasmodium vivax North Korean TaxID=1035514 RepID=A0A0J9TSY7_PLAVI|nr:hypothetical protein PVNG_04355 [Plasmodium vivax North Korean]
MNYNKSKIHQTNAIYNTFIIKYDSVSEIISAQQRIKKECNVGTDEENNKPCDRLIFGDDCNDTNFYRNCLIADKYLTHLKDNSSELNINVACKYFSYWTYKEMLSDNKHSYSVRKLHEIIIQSKPVHICKDYVEDITTETFKNIDNLNKLYQNFMEILRVDDKYTCNQAKICVDLYKSLEKTCYSNSDDLFCKGIEKFREAYNKTMETKEICKEYKILQPSPKHSERSSNTIPVVAITAISFASIMTYKVNKCYS